MRRSLLPAVFAVLAASLIIGTTLAADGGPDWSSEPRSIQFQDTPDGFQAASTRSTDEADDVFSVVFASRENRLTATFQDRTQPNMTPIQVAMVVVALVEYDDSDGDGGYGLGDPIRQRIRLSDLDPAREKVEALEGGGWRATYEFSVVPEFNQGGSGGGRLTLTYMLFPQEQVVNGVLVAPLDVAIQLRVDQFPYAENATLLGAETRLESNHVLARQGSSFRVESGAERVSYAWPGESIVDGDARPVHVTLLDTSAPVSSSASSAVLLHSFERGNVTYQPTLGVAREQSSGAPAIVKMLAHGNWVLYSAGVLVAAVVIGGTIWLRRR